MEIFIDLLLNCFQFLIVFMLIFTLVCAIIGIWAFSGQFAIAIFLMAILVLVLALDD